MRSRPEPKTTTLSSQTATGLHDIKSPTFPSERDRSREKEEEEEEEGNTVRVVSLQEYEVLLRRMCRRMSEEWIFPGVELEIKRGVTIAMF